jgi:NTE family protein
LAGGISLFGLVCSGGGAVGAYQVGALKYIHENFCNSGASPFQVFTGISCGSLNAAFLAAHSLNAEDDIAYLEDLWLRFHIPDYHGDLSKKFLVAALKKIAFWGKKDRNRGALLDPTPMIDIINAGFSTEDLQKCFENRTTLGLGIATTEMMSGTPVWFLDGPNAAEWSRFHSVGKVSPITTNHVAASCSVPVFLPPVKLDDYFYLDGGVNLNRPLSAAIAMGATKIFCIRTSVSLHQKLPIRRKAGHPSAANLIKFLLKSIAKDATFAEIEQIEVLNRVYEQVKPLLGTSGEEGTNNAIFDKGFSLANYKPISTFSLSPTEEPSAVFKEFNALRPDPSKRSTHEFSFHKDYIALLIDLGYEDAKAKHGEMEPFFQN